MAPAAYEDRQFLEKTLIDDLIAAQEAGADTRPQVQAIAEYLAAERRRVEGLRREPARDGGAARGARRTATPLHPLRRARARARVQLPLEAQGRDGGASRSAVEASEPRRRRGRPEPAEPSEEVCSGSASTPLLEIDELGRWLAASGVIVHLPGSQPSREGPPERGGSLRVRVRPAAGGGEEPPGHAAAVRVRDRRPHAAFRERPPARTLATSWTRRRRRTASACASRAWTRRRRTP